MWILCKNGIRIVNSNQVKCFEVTSYDENVLWADDIELGIFLTRNEAKKELDQIYNFLAVGANSYSVG